MSRNAEMMAVFALGYVVGMGTMILASCVGAWLKDRNSE